MRCAVGFEFVMFWRKVYHFKQSLVQQSPQVFECQIMHPAWVFSVSATDFAYRIQLKSFPCLHSGFGVIQICQFFPFKVYLNLFFDKFMFISSSFTKDVPNFHRLCFFNDFSFCNHEGTLISMFALILPFWLLSYSCCFNELC